MERPREASELIRRFILWVVVVAIAWPFIGLVIVFVEIIAGNSNPS